MLSYATDYTTDAIVVRTPIQQIHVANVRRETDSQRLARIRLNLRYPSIVFNATYHKDALSTEKGVGRQQQQGQEMTFFNRNRLSTDQVVCVHELTLVSFKLQELPLFGNMPLAHVYWLKSLFFAITRLSNQDAMTITVFAIPVDPLHLNSMRLASDVYHIKRQAVEVFPCAPIRVRLVIIPSERVQYNQYDM